VTGAKTVPLNQLEQKLPAAVKNTSLPLLLVCATGARAQRAVATAKKLGYEQAQAVAGGLKSWKDANLPLEKA
jgi:rhodanese-related sulfurtransferase